MSEQVAAVTGEAPKFVYEPEASAGKFVMLIAQEEVPTVDGRQFAAGAIKWRELPIPLTLNRSNTAEGQHKTAVGIGAITRIERQGNNIYGWGYFSSDEAGQEARALIKEGTISGVSADVGGVAVEELEVEGGVRKLFTAGTIIGVTALLHASFNATKIAVDEGEDDTEDAEAEDTESVESDEEDALTAAASRGWTPPDAAFGNPNLAGPTPLTVTDDGRVYGHAAVWGSCHVGYRDRCVTPPRSRRGYQFFNTGEIVTASGKRVPVGRITANTNHASIELGAQPAKDHYDHTGFAAAYVQSGEDEHGIWFSGVLAPDATPAQIANLRAAGVSGDWRNIDGSLEMVGLLAVNTPGFPIPRAQASIVAGAQMSLVAAGIVDAMMDSTPKGALVERLKILLADTDAVYHSVHGFHWNVKSQDFAQYHDLYGSIYSDLYGSIDPIAENIRKLGVDAPSTQEDFIAMKSIPTVAPMNHTPKEINKVLLPSLEGILASLQAAFMAANTANEQGIANFIAERIDSTQKWIWQITSSLDCGCGCDGECEEGEETEEDEAEEGEPMMVASAEEDCGCNEELGYGQPVQWSSDLDQNYLLQAREHFEELSAISEQAMNFGTRLTMPVQTYASYLRGICAEEINFLDRTLGRPLPTKKEQEEVDSGEEDANEFPVAAYGAELSIESRLTLLDLDLELDV